LALPYNVTRTEKPPDGNEHYHCRNCCAFNHGRFSRTPGTGCFKRLKSLIESSLPMHSVAATLQRSVSAVKGRAHRLKMSIKRTSFGKAKGK